MTGRRKIHSLMAGLEPLPHRGCLWSSQAEFSAKVDGLFRGRSAFLITRKCMMVQGVRGSLVRFSSRGNLGRNIYLAILGSFRCDCWLGGEVERLVFSLFL